MPIKDKKQMTKNEHFFTRSIAILAGGRSSRFGSEKAFAPFLGRRVIDFVLKACFESGADIYIIANRYKYSQLGFPTFSDHYQGLGPLAGIHSALKNIQDERILIVGCDMPLLNPCLIEWMLRLKREEQITIPEYEGKLQPLHAIYSRSLLPLIEKRLQQKKLSLYELLGESSYYKISQKHVVPYCPHGLCFASTNTKEELKRLEAAAPAYFEKVLS